MTTAIAVETRNRDAMSNTRTVPDVYSAATTRPAADLSTAAHSTESVFTFARRVVIRSDARSTRFALAWSLRAFFAELVVASSTSVSAFPNFATTLDGTF